MGRKALFQDRLKDVNVQAGGETKETTGVAREEALWMGGGAGGWWKSGLPIPG